MTKKTSKPENTLLPPIVPETKHGHEEVTLPEGVIDLGAAMRAALPQLEKMASDFTIHCQNIRKQMEGITETCLDHEEVNLAVDWEQTFGRSWQENKLVPIFGKCPKCELERSKSIVNDKWIKMGIPKKVSHATMENFVVVDSVPEFAKARTVAHEKMRRQLLKDKGFIILIGEFGTGKSHLGAAAIRYKGKGIFITMANLIAQLRLTYGEEGEREDFAERFQNTPLLVIDELSTEVRGTDIAPLLYRILAHRHDCGLLTVITTNEELDVVKEILGGRLVDRVGEDYVVANFIWKSARKATHENH